MTKRKMKKMAETYKKELEWRIEDSSRRPTRESRGRAEAYKDAEKLFEGMIECWRWL